MLARGSIVGCQVLSLRHKNPVPYFSPSRLQGVGTFGEREKGGRTTRVRAHENKTTREAGGSPEIPSHHLSSESCACEVSLNFLSTGGTSEDIVIRSRTTCSLNDVT